MEVQVLRSFHGLCGEIKTDLSCSKAAVKRQSQSKRRQMGRNAHGWAR